MPFNELFDESGSNIYNESFVSLKCGFPDTVHKIIAGAKDIVIDGVYTLSDKLKTGNIVFVTLGGDVGSSEVDWNPGFFAIAHVIKSPYDHGYNEKQKYFKFNINIDITLNKALKREDFINYRNAFDARFIGPELTRDPSQALSSLGVEKAVSVIRCVLEREPYLEEQIEKVFPSWFIELVHSSIQMLLPVDVKFKQKLTEAMKNSVAIAECMNRNQIDESKRKKGASNILYYGVPGAGKSYQVTADLKKLISQDKDTREEFSRRIVFHPDYTYSDFVGQIMPVLYVDEQGKKKVKYDFVAGPFADIMRIAYENPEQNCALVIEELNRGNAPAIFGEIFQLLDRDEATGESEYGIHNKELAKYIYDLNDEEASKRTIRISSNLSIIATMNTSDQNVFAMDTAFQRRWQMRHIPNCFDGKNKKQVESLICQTPISWGVFAQTVNDKLTDISFAMSSNEDKGLGVYFAKGTDLTNEAQFAEKVLKYLWDDAFKLERDKLFKKEYKTLSKLIEDFESGAAKALEKVILKEVYDEMVNKAKVFSNANDVVTEVQENIEETSNTYT